jgi:hypothetical membrane protein
MEKIDRFYRKFNGSYFFFISVAISIVSIVISIALYTAGGASYSILTNFISDLGAISAPNNAFIVFSIGLIVQSIIYPFGALFLVLYFQKKEVSQNWIIRLWFLIEIVSACATFLVALFPEDTMRIPHATAAAFIFFFGMLSNLFYGILVVLAKKISKFHSIPGFVMAVISIIFMLSWILVDNISVITVCEWLVLFGGWFFSIYIGFLTLKSQ